MKIKIKAIPEDFIVEEISDFQRSGSGPFAFYVLEKRGWNTLDALKMISRETRVPLKDFSYGGKKDRHGLTRQFISVRRRGRLSVRAKEGYSLTFAGFGPRPMGPHFIQGNRFEMTVRDLRDAEAKNALGEVGRVKTSGFPNYFDDQRFRSYDADQGFFAEKILKKHYNGALKVFMVSRNAADKPQDAERKRFFLSSWKNWKACRRAAVTDFERHVFELLERKPDFFLPALQRIPREEASMRFSSYQSFLWNEVLRRLLKEILPGVLSDCPGETGDYLFYNEITKELFLCLKNMEIPLAAANARMPDPRTERIYRQLLEERGIKPAQFNIRGMRQAFFKASPRRAVIVPDDLHATEEPDETANGRRKLRVRCVLPRGSYGTILLKRLFILAGERPGMPGGED
jgi:tRNA pseudouridine13 synthase